MCLPVLKSGCFLFGIIVIVALLSLTIYTVNSHKPFAVWVSLLVATLLALIFVVTITLGHLRYDPAQRGSGNYIVPLSDEEIELYHIATSPRAPNHDDIAHEEAYRQLLATRPLPPTPMASSPRRDSPSPTLISPLSDQFIQGHHVVNGTERLGPYDGGRTLRLVPESSVASRI